MNDSTREREGQLRELISIDKEFRKIEEEVGGSNALGALDSLEVDGLFDAGSQHSNNDRPVKDHLQPLAGITEDGEEDEDEAVHILEDNDTEEELEDVFGERSTLSRSHARRRRAADLPPSPYGKAGDVITVPSVLPHLAHMRTITSSVVRSLSMISEFTQENSAATADAGRKIRALRNRMTTLQSEWDSAEKSRQKIEEWEKEEAKQRRVDGRLIVEQQLAAFEKAVMEAGAKTKAIMAAA
jgi:hypothetical protein